MDSRKRRTGVPDLTIADPKTALPPNAAMRPVPAYGRVKKASATDREAASAAGAGLAAVDAVVRAEPAFGGPTGQ